MSATDNILAGIAGFGEGIRDVLVPYKQAEFKQRLESIPISRIKGLTGEDYNLPDDTFISPTELGVLEKQASIKAGMEKEQRMDERANKRFEQQNDIWNKRFQMQGDRQAAAAEKAAINAASFKLKDDYTKDSGKFTETRDAYNRIIAVSKNPSPAGDVALIFSFMRMQDPTSTVREGEFATAQNAASWPERVRAQYNKALEGTLLTESIRNDFVKQGQSLYDTAYAQQKKVDDIYTKRAMQYGVDPKLVVADLGSISVPETIAKQTTVNHDEALAWAAKNPDDPRAKIIQERAKKALTVKK